MVPAGPDVAIYIEDLDGGGVQAMKLRTARELVARGRRVELIVGTATGALTDDVPAGVGIVQHVDAAAMEFWLAYKNYSLVNGGDIGLAGAEDLHSITAGTRIRF